MFLFRWWLWERFHFVPDLHDDRHQRWGYRLGLNVNLSSIKNAVRRPRPSFHKYSGHGSNTGSGANCTVSCWRHRYVWCIRCWWNVLRRMSLWFIKSPFSSTEMSSIPIYSSSSVFGCMVIWPGSAHFSSAVVTILSSSNGPAPWLIALSFRGHRCLLSY